MYCKNCGMQNDEDALFCKQCGVSLQEKEILNDKPKDSKKQNKNKTKTKYKTKNKTKTKVKKEKPRKNKYQKSEKGMTFGQKILMFLLFLMVLTLAGALVLGGYHYYKSRSVEVPNLINMTYEQAELTLAKKDLKIKKVEKQTENQNKENIVIDQNKTPGKKVRKNTTIKVTVGKYQETYIVEDFTGMNIDEVIQILDNKNIKYKIKYKDNKEYENYTIISQSPKKGIKITSNDRITLVVSKNPSTNSEENEDLSEENNSADNQNDIENSEENIKDNKEVVE